MRHQKHVLGIFFSKILLKLQPMFPPPNLSKMKLEKKQGGEKEMGEGTGDIMNMAEDGVTLKQGKLAGLQKSS